MNKPKLSAKPVAAGSRYGIYRRHDRRHDLYGWEVSIGRDGRLVGNAYFADLKHGGEDASLRAAQVYRDKVLREHPPVARAVISQRLSVRNTSGHPGVHMVRQRGKVIGCNAKTNLPGGKLLCRYFGFHTHGGRDRAIALAVEERQRQLMCVESVALRSAEAKVLCPSEPEPVTPDKLRPRRKHAGLKALPKPRLDQAREDKVAAAILKRHGRHAPNQPGRPVLRWICRYRCSKHGTTGWRVLIVRKGNRLTGRIFMDSRHGGAANGFELARRYRDQQLASLPVP